MTAASDWPRLFLHPRCFCLAFYFHTCPSSSKLMLAKADQAKQGNDFNLSHDYWCNLSNARSFMIIRYLTQLKTKRN